eukprot:g3797.t1
MVEIKPLFSFRRPSLAPRQCRKDNEENAMEQTYQFALSCNQLLAGRRQRWLEKLRRIIASMSSYHIRLEKEAMQRWSFRVRWMNEMNVQSRRDLVTRVFARLTGQYNMDLVLQRWKAFMRSEQAAEILSAAIVRLVEVSSVLTLQGYWRRWLSGIDALERELYWALRGIANRHYRKKLLQKVWRSFQYVLEEKKGKERKKNVLTEVDEILARTEEYEEVDDFSITERRDDEVEDNLSNDRETIGSDWENWSGQFSIKSPWSSESIVEGIPSEFHVKSPEVNVEAILKRFLNEAERRISVFRTKGFELSHESPKIG